jgi:hypothetical protein
MFIIKTKPNRESKILLRAIRQKFKTIPPHWELLAHLNPARFKMFLDEMEYISSHPNIDPHFFSMLRYSVAWDNGFEYCKQFNTTLLQTLGYTKDQLERIKNDKKIPLDTNHQILFDSVMTALYDPANFNEKLINGTKEFGWSDGDIYDALDHGAFLFKYSKILKAYLKGE